MSCDETRPEAGPQACDGSSVCPPIEVLERAIADMLIGRPATRSSCGTATTSGVLVGSSAQGANTPDGPHERDRRTERGSPGAEVRRNRCGYVC